jgi:hypothetical protein
MSGVPVSPYDEMALYESGLCCRAVSVGALTVSVSLSDNSTDNYDHVKLYFPRGSISLAGD